MKSIESLNPPSRTKTILLYAGGVVVVLLLVVAALVVLSRDSQPGDALYGFKTDVVERAPLFLTSDDQAQVTHLEGLLENRLGEVQRLIVTQELTTERAQAIQTEMTKILAAYETALTRGEMSPSATLASTQTVMAVGEAIDTLTFREVDDETQAEFGAIMENASDIAFTQRERFLTEASTSTVEIYVSEQVADLMTKIEDQSITQSDLTEISTFINRANDALAAGQFDRAVAFVGRAQLIADLARYQTLPLELAPEVDPSQLEGEG